MQVGEMNPDQFWNETVASWLEVCNIRRNLKSRPIRAARLPGRQSLKLVKNTQKIKIVESDT